MRLTGLDALRGIAALIVLVWHLLLMTGTGDIPAGFLAVDFFFVLSGYVMARTYEPKLGRSLSGTDFFLKRYRRFWPVMALAALITLPVAMMLADGPRWFALSLFIIPSFDGRFLFPLNGPAWSLFFELVLNLVHGFALYRIGSKGLARLCLILGAVAGVMAYNFGSHGLGMTPDTFLGGFPRAFFAYILGILLWRTWQDKTPIRVSPALTAILLPATILAASILPLWSGVFFVLLVCPILIAGGLRWDAGPFGAVIGALSFPLYALHFPILRYLLNYPAMGFAASIAVAAIVATAPTYFTKTIKPFLPVP